MQFDYLIVGSGLCGSTFARLATNSGKKCIVIEKRNHIGGNCWSTEIEGIDVCSYGPHVFHTADSKIWHFLDTFTRMRPYRFCAVSSVAGKYYSWPISLATRYQVFDDRFRDPLDTVELATEPKNMEEWCLTNIGRTMYEMFVRGYTIKQWKKHPRELPVSIAMKRMSNDRNTFDTSYFPMANMWQGYPKDGFHALFESLLDGIEVRTGVDFFKDRKLLTSLAARIVYTGKLDEYFGYSLGRLDYRSLKFENRSVAGDYQGIAMVNYPSDDVPYTRVVEHKFFDPQRFNPRSIVTFEYPDDYDTDVKVPFYPVNTTQNNYLKDKYLTMSRSETRTTFVGRLAEYRYYDMTDAISAAFDAVRNCGLSSP